MRKFVFIHIPKTAGTSFRAALGANIGRAAVSPPFPASHLSPAQACELDAYQVIAGHISFADVATYFPDRLILTIVREPIDRCLSWYYFARKLDGQLGADVLAAAGHDVEGFFSLDPTIVFRNIYNRQCRQLGDHVLNADVDLDKAYVRAQDTVREAAWVGSQETITADVARLVKMFPEFSGLSLEHMNATSERMSKAGLGGDLAAKIARYNEYDSRLFAGTRALCPPAS